MLFGEFRGTFVWVFWKFLNRNFFGGGIRVGF